MINATVNPDFGQVEADPAFVNLTAYEVTLPEKRPFFVENNNLFHNYEATYFYSRRIGGLPTRLPAYDAIDLPQPGPHPRRGGGGRLRRSEHADRGARAR